MSFLSIAAIKFFTDYPNAVPVGSDFFVLQRNQSYINASRDQVKNDWFTSPVFTGNGLIGGNWVIGGVAYGNGGGLTNVPGISGNFFAATNGVGQNPTFYGGGNFFGTYFFDEVDATSFFPTNLFTGLTNYAILGTDANGKLTLGSTVTNLIVTNLVSITETNNTFVNTNVMILQSNATFTVKKGATIVIETNAFLVDSNITASSAVVTDAKQSLTNAANAHGVFTNSASGPPSFGLLQATEIAAGIAPFFNGINFTNESFALNTNNVGGGAFVFGGPGTASTLYDTNITAATTLKLFDISACGATAGGMKIYVTCSGGTDRVLTFPAGCSGAGLGTPPAVTITNAKAAFFDVIYKPGATPVTNVFWSPVF